MSTDLQPDPSKIGAVTQPPFAVLPSPAKLFSARAERFDRLAPGSRLGPYLGFLTALSRVQAELATSLLPLEPMPADEIDRARGGKMPPIDRANLVEAPELETVLDLLVDAAQGIDQPAPARAALDALASADQESRRWLLAGALSDHLPADAAAAGVYAAAAVQLHAARLAATLDADRLVPVSVGVCPACGGRPASSVVMGGQRIEGARYACCATCATQWNEVRVKCLCCGSTKGISYRGLADEAPIRAEVCGECHSWVKILYRTIDPGLDPIADDIASLGLDARMRESEWHRAGFNPYLTGF